MSTVISSLLTNLTKFLQDHHVSFSNGLLILLTVGGEQIFRSGEFKCPCTHPEAWTYAFVFFLVPSVVLAVMGLAVSNLTWRIFHGCCRRSHRKENGTMKVIPYIIALLSRSAVVPVAWLFLMFLDGSYFACLKSENPCETDAPEYKMWKTMSQIIAWCLLLVTVVLSFLVIGILRCCDTVTYNQNKYIKAYREAEERQFILETQEKTDVLAKANVQNFIGNPNLEKRDWDEVSMVPELCYSFPPLSSLHQWVRVQNQINPAQ